MLRIALMSGCFLLAACTGEETGGGGTGTTALDACRMATTQLSCPSCSDGELTCSYDGVSATETSCGDCQALASLYQALCDAGNEASQQEIEDGAVCVAPDYN